MEIAITIMVGVICALGGYLLAMMNSKKNARSQAAQIKAEAERQSDIIKEKARLKAQEDALKITSEAERTVAQKNQKLQSAESRARQREQQLNQQQNELQRRRNEMETLRLNVENQQQVVERRSNELDRLIHQAQEELEHVSGLSADEAKERLVESLKDEAKTAAAGYINDIMDEAKLTAGKEAKRIVVQTIQRVATETAMENSVTVFHIDNDEIKGRIIGREGRNIRALEAATGIEIIVDDTPEAIVLSGFDPVRREIARLALHQLVVDGRIHPARIEEVVAKVRRQVEE